MRTLLIGLSLAARAWNSAVVAAAATPIDFEREIRPLLIARCLECHGADVQKGGLRFDVRHAALRGGDSGPVIDPGRSAQSELYRRIASDDADDRMPPEGPPLSAAEIALFAQWIDAGAEWPETDYDRAAARDGRLDHWAFQPLTTSAPDASAAPVGHGSSAIDHFVRAKLSEVGLRPAPPADRPTLLRRLWLDMLGLPPAIDAIQSFVNDPHPDAWEKRVDEALASPRYGERWAQHWLDVVRYADTHGFEVNTPRENAWPYRDYVIQAFNEDLPYDQFAMEQIAGDALGADEATGLLVASAVLLPGQIGADDVSKRLARQDALDEIVVGVSGVFLGLTMGCARCHDHKFDPLSMRDYYALQAFVAGVEYSERPIVQTRRFHTGEGGAPTVFGGTFRQPDVTSVLHRGNPEQPGELLGPAFPALFGQPAVPSDLSEQQRRLALAKWIASAANPLTARVMVNRIWQHHFGRGLVDTPNDFGLNGARPSHPQLLDWLAAELIRVNWSIKRIHRLILLSESYQQSSAIDPQAVELDRDNQWLWRFTARRLESEAIRDSMLAVSGELNLKSGGPGFNFFKSRGGLDGFPPVETFGPDERRRMIYAHKVRMEPTPVFGAFDCPDAGQSMPKRGRSTTAIQSLNLFNSPFVGERAERFAARVAAEHQQDADRQACAAFEAALGREPSDAERRASVEAVQQHGLATLCRALFNTNEFLYLP